MLESDAKPIYWVLYSAIVQTDNNLKLILLLFLNNQRSPYSSSNLKKHSSSSGTSFNDSEYKKQKIEAKTSTEEDDYNSGVLGVTSVHHLKKEFNEHSPRSQYRPSSTTSINSTKHHH